MYQLCGTCSSSISLHHCIRIYGTHACTCTGEMHMQDEIMMLLMGRCFHLLQRLTTSNYLFYLMLISPVLSPVLARSFLQVHLEVNARKGHQPILRDAGMYGGSAGELLLGRGGREACSLTKDRAQGVAWSMGDWTIEPTSCGQWSMKFHEISGGPEKFQTKPLFGMEICCTLERGSALTHLFFNGTAICWAQWIQLPKVTVIHRRFVRLFRLNVDGLKEVVRGA